MFKVECPGCKASYNVDERRVPAGTGMKMRCPKCATTFQVKRPDEEADLPTPAAPRAAEPARALKTPPPVAPSVRRATVVGLGELAPGLPGAPAVARPAPPAGGEEDLLPAVVMPKGRTQGQAPAANPAPPRPAAPPARAPAPSRSAVEPTRPAATPDIDDIDLPAVAADLPVAAKPRARTVADPSSAPGTSPSPMAAVPDLDLDLPAPRREMPSHSSIADLPVVRPAGAARPSAPSKAPRQITGGVLFDDLDLPAVGGDLPAPRGADLPAVRGADLPAVRGPDLPAVKGSVSVPDARGSGGFGEIDLPMAAASLPAVAANLPAVAAGLPAVAAGLPATAAGLPMVAAGLPAIGGGFGDDFDFDNEPPRGAPATTPAGVQGGGGIGLPRAPSIPEFGAVGMPGFDDDPFGKPLTPMSPQSGAPRSVPAVPTQPAGAAAPIRRQSGGGTDFGEVNLGGGDDDFGPSPGVGKVATPSAPAASVAGWGERDLGGSTDESMEFEAIPQEKGEAGGDEGRSSALPAPSAASSSTAVAPPRARPSVPTDGKSSSGKGFRVAAAVLLLTLLGGGALTFTQYGPFGYNAITDAVRAKDYEALRASTLTMLREEFAHDTSSAASVALERAEANHAKLPRAGSVTALAVYAAYLKELRFGHDAAQHAHATTLLATLPSDDPPPGYELARIAQAAASDQLARAQSQADAALRRAPADVDLQALAAEVALQGRDADKALAGWTKLTETAPSPRSYFGLARAHLLKRDAGAAREAARKVLTTEPKHVGALLLMAKSSWETDRDEAAATRYLEQVSAEAASASKEEVVMARTLAGQIHLSRSRVSAAEAAFGEALKLNSKASGALNGMGETLYRAGRFSEALARFGSAMEADPEAIEPKLGVAKTKLSLERLQEAKELMRGLDKKLRDEGKPNFHVMHWKGRVNEALGDKAAAEADYAEALKLAGEHPDSVETYVAIAQLLYSQGRPAEAQSRLDEARNKLPKSVTLYKALGDLASMAGRYSEAEAHYTNALQMDPQDISTRFRLGTVLRRLGKFDAAGEALDKVAAADKDYPGLALERAVLYESSGQSSKAVELYESALAKAPNDPDLMLRVAAALLAANQPGQLARAEELLRKVMQQRQNSAEANHFLGRALLMKGTNLAEALRYLRRATDVDPNRAEFFLYVGWAANDADDQQLASTALAKAIDLDKSLADAYWQRGVLRRRQRSLADAEQDLLRALELRPSRYEAYATLAEVYEDEQKWVPAQTAWQKAIAADGKNALWRFRLGKLLYQHGSRPASLEHLTQAVQLASQQSSPPNWMAEACLLLGDVERSAGKKPQAIEHLQRFLSLAPMDSPYRTDALTMLRSLGVNGP